MEDHKFYGITPELLSNDFIAGLIVGEGTFFWTTNKNSLKKIPAFALKFHIRDFDLLINVKYSLKLEEKIHEYTHKNRHYAFLIVRSFYGLRRIIEDIYPHLSGHKKIQFIEWFKKFGDENARSQDRSIYNVFKLKFPELYK